MKMIKSVMLLAVDDLPHQSEIKYLQKEDLSENPAIANDV